MTTSCPYCEASGPRIEHLADAMALGRVHVTRYICMDCGVLFALNEKGNFVYAVRTNHERRPSAKA